MEAGGNHMQTGKRIWKIKQPILKRATFYFDCGSVEFHGSGAALEGRCYNKKGEYLTSFQFTHTAHNAYAITKTTASKWLRQAIEEDTKIQL
jgi:hypothetical protein